MSKSKAHKSQQFTDSLSAYRGLQQQIREQQFAGYFDVDLASERFANDTLFATLDLGTRYKGINLQNGNVAPALIIDLGLKPQFQKNTPIALNALEKTYTIILNYYQNNGHPFAQVWLDSLAKTNEGLQAKIFINEGKKITLDTLRLVGSAKLSQAYLSSYLALKNGDYNEERIQSIDKRLRDLSFITLPKPPEVVFSGNSAKINLFVDKQNANQFDGVIGFLPNAQTGKLQLTGDFKLNLKNALKNGETLDFNYRGLPSQSQELNLAFVYPYLFKSQLGLSAGFQLFKRDTSFLNLNTKLAFDYNFSLSKKISFFLENFNGNQVADNPTANIPNNANINSVFYGIALAYINLDNKITPLKGADLNLQLSAGQRKVTPSQNFNPQDFFEKTKSQQFKVQADLKYYFKLGTKAVLFAHNKSAILTGKNIFENEAFRIGGFKTLRGFDEQSINVNSFSIQTTEFRYFVEKNSYLNVFYDQAYTYQNFINQKSTDYPLGIGAGITFQTKIGITSLSYAIGKQKNIPLDLQKGKIHIGILSYF
ncbi:ShlB/FhaC/HecB family hemolysin secretion/activation protein [Pedobacter arcticus]|uniref:ShlB/FhaC/HecB family hemolysin secretion/activation protein n=1 Tax=Pedobacter arcticus TaxID=752140 RepID=UPI00187339D2|nr:ShlB/FhaC/HecB family hemolysin secretion/activation protein [Pedobacter arcticus]